MPAFARGGGKRWRAGTPHFFHAPAYIFATLKCAWQAWKRNIINKLGGPWGTRTPDLLHAMQTL